MSKSFEQSGDYHPNPGRRRPGDVLYTHHSRLLTATLINNSYSLNFLYRCITNRIARADPPYFPVLDLECTRFSTPFIGCSDIQNATITQLSPVMYEFHRQWNIGTGVQLNVGCTNFYHSVFAPIKLDTLESPASAHTHRVSSDHGDGIFFHHRQPSPFRGNSRILYPVSD